MASRHISFISIFLLISNCTRDWKNPVESIPIPSISDVKTDSKYNVVIYLEEAYGEKYKIILERKSIGGYVDVNYEQENPVTLIDTTIDKEITQTYLYRVKIGKDGYQTDYSEPKSFQYIAKILNAPVKFKLSVVELQGIRLEWQDKSVKEDEYILERNGIEIAKLEANSQTYFDVIEGMPPAPLSLSYRLKAYNNNLSSEWIERNIEYTGIGVPTNLRITDTTFYHFTIEWQDNSNIETGYVIERSKNGGLYEEVAQVNTNVTRYSDKITETGSYSYRVRAKKDNLYSLYSNEVSYNIKIVLPTEGLVAYYPFNSNANDESGNGNNGTVHGAILTNDRFGNKNGALNFDGVDDYISVPNSSSLQSPAKEVTINAWINIAGWYNDWAVICTKGNVFAFGQYHISYHRTDGFYFRMNNNELFLGTFPFVLNKWYFITARWDGYEVKFYVNGVEAGKKSFSATLTIDNYPLEIGRDIPGNIEYFNGMIDEVRIYSRALTESEIQAIYHEGGWGD